MEKLFFQIETLQIRAAKHSQDSFYNFENQQQQCEAYPQFTANRIERHIIFRSNSSVLQGFVPGKAAK